MGGCAESGLGTAAAATASLCILGVPRDGRRVWTVVSAGALRGQGALRQVGKSVAITRTAITGDGHRTTTATRSWR